MQSNARIRTMAGVFALGVGLSLGGPARAQYQLFFGGDVLLPNGTKIGTPPGSGKGRFYPPETRRRAPRARYYVPTTRYVTPQPGYYVPQTQAYAAQPRYYVPSGGYYLPQPGTNVYYGYRPAGR